MVEAGLRWFLGYSLKLCHTLRNLYRKILYEMWNLRPEIHMRYHEFLGLHIYKLFHYNIWTFNF